MVFVVALLCILSTGIDGLSIQNDFVQNNNKHSERRTEIIDKFIPYFHASQKDTDVERSLRVLNQLTKMSPLTEKAEQHAKRVSMPGPVTGPNGSGEIFWPKIPDDLSRPPLPLENYEWPSIDMPIEDVLSSMVIESSGLWDDGGVTIGVYLPVPADCTWILSRGGSDVTYTRGRFRSSPSDTLTSIALDAAELLNTIDLYITISKNTMYIRFDLFPLFSPGEMHLTLPGLIFEVPDQVSVTEDGDATFTVRVPPVSGPDVRPGLDVFYTFLNTSSDIPFIDSDLLYTRYDVPHSPSGSESQDSMETVTINVGPNAQRFGGTVSVATSYISFSSQEVPSKSYIKFINVAKAVTVVPYEEPLVEGVAFGSYNYMVPLRQIEVLPTFIRHGSIYCAAAGNPPPKLSITKDGYEVKTYRFGELGVFRRIFHPLDGSLAADVAGVYTCTATSGNMTISREILAISEPPRRW